MEPLFPKEDHKLSELLLEVHFEAASLTEILHTETRKEVVRLLRHINSYYSNRIEGEHTTPADIERAVKEEYSSNEKKRRLQELSVAHIKVQEALDERLNSEPELNICASEFLCWLHKEFYRKLPDPFLWVENSEGERFKVIPGEIRKQDVKVGDHIAPDWRSLERFLKRFTAYNPADLHGMKRLSAVAASHHRLTWIHPFLDGNGRVSRLFSYAFMRRARLDSHGLWTISRGLARNADAYKRMLAEADSSRRGDYDGRGYLSEKALREFSLFFFETALDQINFMKELLNLENLRERIEGYVNLRSQGMLPGEKPLRPEAARVLGEVMMRGFLARGEAQAISGLGERVARELTSQLLSEKLLVSDTHRAPLKFHIPAKVIGYYFPDLYPAGSI